ncbi:hypothetical protein [Clostridium aminobutyricum]|uniref:Uncharacterized protein n=1 Tax=Clostridium aminobutyricum TaxID=33953 RepID=A0A939DA26_CLOAM|nr:hypothetical protein [Clostridium aminobutyricum]MBN7773827.1 hypothetical protein [Clostridium aminobutyricum]
MLLIATSLSFLILLLSFLGYIMLVRQTLWIQSKFSWIFTFSTLSCILYFAGLIGILSYVAYGIFFCGLGFFIYFYIIREKSVFGLKAFNLLNFLYGLGFGIIFISLISTQYIHYDNFSHWGLVVKYMLIHDAFPNAASALIDFKTYPLGSSVFLYYVCRIVGNTQGVMLVGQSMLIFSCFYAMFGIIRDTKRFLLCSGLALCCAAMTFFNISIRINNLLVDFLLPLLALSVITVLFVYRNDWKRACIVSAPILALLVIVKNSGLFFAVICYVYLLYLALSNKKYKGKKAKALLLAVLTIAVSLTTFAAWNLHTSIAFKGETTKHTMSVENFNEISSEKTPEIKAAIVQRFSQAVFSPGSLSTRGIVLFQLLALAACLTARLLFKQRWGLIKVLFWVDIAVVLYYAGILSMFIYTMPTEEALILAGFERYASSIVVFMIGILALFGVHDTENSFYIQQGEKRNVMAFKSLLTKNAYEVATVILVSAAVIILLSEVNGMTSMKFSYPYSLPGKIEHLVGDNWSGEDQQSYLFYASDTDSQISNYYLQYSARYFLFAPKVDAIYELDKSAFLDQLKGYDYLVVLESDSNIAAFLRDYGKTGDITGIYPIKETFF